MTGMCSSPLGIHLVFIVFKYLMLYSLPKALQAYCFIAREHASMIRCEILRSFAIPLDSQRWLIPAKPQRLPPWNSGPPPFQD